MQTIEFQKNKKLDNKQFHLATVGLSRRERELTYEMLWHLKEIESRRLFCEFGYGNLLQYCVQELKYSESSAYRRIQSMRLLKELPEIALQIQTGEMTLSNLSAAQSLFRNLKVDRTIENGKVTKVSAAEKLNILNQVANKSQKQAEMIFKEILPDATPKPVDRPLSKEKHLLQFSVSSETRLKLQELEELSGLPHDLEKLFDLMLDKTLEVYRKKRGKLPQVKVDSDSRKTNGAEFLEENKIMNLTVAGREIDKSRTPLEQNRSILRKAGKPLNQSGNLELQKTARLLNQNGYLDLEVENRIEIAMSTECGNQIAFELVGDQPEASKPKTAAVKTQSDTDEMKRPVKRITQPLNKRKYISIKTRRYIFQRAQHQCEYIHPSTKQRCCEKRFLHLDHVKPLVRNGGDFINNLQVLCAAHNLWKGMNSFACGRWTV